MDVLCIGTAVVDLAALPMPPRELWQEKQRIGQIKIMAGGDAANQSIRLADYKRKVYLCAAIGGDTNGLLLKGILEERNVH